MLRYGGATRRPGFRYIAQTKNNNRARLIPFLYSTEQHYVLEFTEGKIRFYTQGSIILDDSGKPYEVSTEYKTSELATIKYAQSADTLFLVQSNHAPSTLTRYGVNDWRFSVMDIKDGVFDDADPDSGIQISASDTDGEITLTATSAVFTRSMIGHKMRIAHLVPSQFQEGVPTASGGVTTTVTVFDGALGNSSEYGKFSGTVEGTYLVKETYTDPDTGETTTSQVTKTYQNTVSNWDIFASAYTGTLTGFTKSGTAVTNATVDGSGKFTLRDSSGTTVSNISGILQGSFTGKPTGATSKQTRTTGLQVSVCPKASVYIESFGFWDGVFTIQKEDETGAWVDIKTQSGNRSQNYNMTYTNDSNEIRDYRVISSTFNNAKQGNENASQRGKVAIQSFAYQYYGVVKLTEYVSQTQVKGTVLRRLGSTKATWDYSFDAWDSSKGYPQAVGFFEDRLIFAGTKDRPQTYWASKTADYYDFGTSSPTLDTDAITGTISSGQMNGIKAIISFGEILMMTTGGEYRVGGGSNAFTPSNQQAKAQEYRGINDVPPVVIGSRVIYIQRQSTIVRDLAYSYDVDKYTGDDVSLLASHLFDGHKLVGMTYQQVPDSVVWCVRDDGMLLGMTYIKEQDVYAWHRHTTDGRFIDVCSVSGENEDELYVCVERDNKYYIEHMGSLIENTNVEQQFYVDAGYYYKGIETDTVIGLSWLAGKEVVVLADGNVVNGLTVDSTGKLTLEHKFSNIIVGLPYITDMETLPIELEGSDGTMASRKKRIQNMCVLFKNSRSGLYGYNGRKLDEIKWRTTENWNEPIRLYTGKRNISLPQSNYGETLQLLIRQKDPLPMTVLAIVPEVLA